MNENDDRGPGLRHSLMRLMHWLPVVAALIVAGCGGGSSSDPRAPVARVEILSAGT